MAAIHCFLIFRETRGDEGQGVPCSQSCPDSGCGRAVILWSEPRSSPPVVEGCWGRCPEWWASWHPGPIGGLSPTATLMLPTVSTGTGTSMGWQPKIHLWKRKWRFPDELRWKTCDSWQLKLNEQVLHKKVFSFTFYLILNLYLELFSYRREFSKVALQFRFLPAWI